MIAYRIQSKKLDELRKRGAALWKDNSARLVAGRAVANEVKDHLFALDSRANKLGGPRSHFYSAAAKSVADPQASGEKVTFEITKIGLALRWLGGTVKAGASTSSATGSLTKYLAIPARTEAVGKPPSEFPDLKFIPRRNGGAMLVQALQTTVSISGRKRIKITRGSEVGGLVMYWLVKQTTNRPDPTVMPTEEQMLETAVDAMGQYISRRLAS
jgi:hypothetical protein